MSNDLKNKLDQEPLEFDTSLAWEQLSPKLETSKDKRRGIIWWWFGGSAGAVLTALAAFYFYPTTSGENAEFMQSARSEHVVSSETMVLPEGAKTTIANENPLPLSSTSELNIAPEMSRLDENRSVHFADTEVNDFSDVKSDVIIKKEKYTVDNMPASNAVRLGESSSRLYIQEGASAEKSSKISQQEKTGQLLSNNVEVSQLDARRVEETTPLLLSSENDLRAKTDGNAMPKKEVSFNALALLGLQSLEIQKSDKLGPIPFVKPSTSIPYGKLTTKPYWQIGVLVGVGYEQVTSTATEFAERTELELRNLQLNVTRSFSKRLAVSAHAQLGQRFELYRTDFTSDMEEVVYNPSALLVGNERFGDSVTVISEKRLQSDRYARFTRLNVGATVEYLIPTRICDYAVYGGINYALLQRWSGSRMVQPEAGGVVVEDFIGPYGLTTYPSRFSYVLGARVSKPIGRQLQLMFDSRVVLASQYSVLPSGLEAVTEQGNSLTVSLGLGWRF